MVSIGRECNFTGGSNVGMVVIFVVVESSMSNYNFFCPNLFWPSQVSFLAVKNNFLFMNSTCVSIKLPLMLTMNVVVPTSHLHEDMKEP
jgi:hypothetical protein